MRRQRSNRAETRMRLRLLGGRIPIASLIQTLAVAEYLNIRHAANALGVAQSGVSARVKALEDDLGILLFERHARGVRLTEARRVFVELVESGVDLIDHAVKTAAIAAAGESGRLRVGIHGLIPGSFLDRLLMRFHAKHPAIAIEMVEGSAREVLAHLHAHRIDVGFLVGTFDLPECHSRPIWTEPLTVAMAEGHRLAERNAVTWPIWRAKLSLSGTAAQGRKSTTISCCAAPRRSRATAHHPAFRGGTRHAAIHGRAGFRGDVAWGGKPAIPDSGGRHAADHG